MPQPQPPNLPPLMTVRSVAVYLGVSEPTIWRWIREGRLKGIKIGNTRRFSADEIASLIGSRAGENPPAEKDATPDVPAQSSAGASWPVRAGETLPAYGTDSATTMEPSPHGRVAALRRRLREMRQEKKDPGGDGAYTTDDALRELRGERS